MNVRLLARRGGGIAVLLTLSAAVSCNRPEVASWDELGACALLITMLSLVWCIGVEQLDLRGFSSHRRSWPGLAPLGRREVSILFVDIRGYTTLTESMNSEQVFHTVSAFARSVSQIVSASGGHVLELAGDGVMAVFDADRGGAEKERRAVAAGLDLVRAFSSRAAEFEPRIRVGVGVATGDAYIGVINLTERRVSSALGNVTSLASRLQTMTRQLDATVIIDARTYAQAGAYTAQFVEHPGVHIRGLSKLQDVYVCYGAQQAAAGADRAEALLRLVGT